MFGKSVQERAVHNYRRIYGDRQPCKGFRKTEHKMRVAAAFSLCNTLNRLHTPRPWQHLMGLCGLHGCGKDTLNIQRSLHLTPKDLSRLRLKPEEYELSDDNRPQDYVVPLALSLGISFHQSRKMELIAEDMRWALAGRFAPMVAAAAMLESLHRHGHEEGLSPEDIERLSGEICQALELELHSVENTRRAFRKYELESARVHLVKQSHYPLDELLESVQARHERLKELEAAAMELQAGGRSRASPGGTGGRCAEGSDGGRQDRGTDHRQGGDEGRC